MPAGYSGTPLIRKLGIKPGFSIRVISEPATYWDWISPLPEEIKVINRAKKEGADFIHLFAKEKKKFEKEFLKFKIELKKDGMLWVSWPKKSSKVESDLDENIIRSYGLANGLVDVKVCAVDEVWSGLKFVYRLKSR
ncbi:MAG: DUF3052 domain-containing protein [Cyclobacteriaceae bacterium]|nr:DUF3052 domain-containing protein [Cyclobacteriaceae bacterium]